jgi:hypothetical protein
MNITATDAQDIATLRARYRDGSLTPGEHQGLNNHNNHTQSF